MHSHSPTVMFRARAALVTGVATAGLLVASGPAAAAPAQKKVIAGAQRTHIVAQKKFVAGAQRTHVVAQKRAVARAHIVGNRPPHG